MALRQLNRTLARGRVCGTPKTGVLGSVIGATIIGDNGVGYLYRYLSLPADNDKEYSGYIPSLPAGLTFEANEDSSFTAYAADGVYVVPVEFRENGVLLATTSFNIVFGSVDVTISAAVGSASAAGAAAESGQDVVISGSVGTAAASGAPASLTQMLTIQAEVGAAGAAGALASVIVEGTISCAIGAAAAAGVNAAVVQSTQVNTVVGGAVGAGATATVTGGDPDVVSPEMIFTVAAEDRTFTVPAEDRIFTVAAEDRTYTV